MANNPTSFRYPIPDDPKQAVRLLMNGMKDLNDAIAALHKQVNTPTTTTTTVVSGNNGGSTPTNLATVSYVDGAINALDVKASCRVATDAGLPAHSYADGVITALGVGALTIDGVAVATNDRVLVKNEPSGFENGIYTVTDPGDGSTQFVLTRSLDCNSSINYITGAFTMIEEGTVNQAYPFVVSTQGMITVGTTSVAWNKLATTGVGTVTNTGTLTLGQLVIGNGSADITVGDLSGAVTTSGATATTLAAAYRMRTVGAGAFDGTALSTGIIATAIQVPFAGTIIGWAVELDVADTISIDVCKKSSSAPPAAPSSPNTTTDKISASAPIATAAAISAATDTTGVSTWTTAVSQWDTVLFNITAVGGTAKRVTVSLRIQQS